MVAIVMRQPNRVTLFFSAHIVLVFSVASSSICLARTRLPPLIKSRGDAAGWVLQRLQSRTTTRTRTITIRPAQTLLAPRFSLLAPALQRRQRHALNDPGLDPVDIELQRLIGGLKERIGTIGESDL
jgi:hypothetical protein